MSSGDRNEEVEDPLFFEDFCGNLSWYDHMRMRVYVLSPPYIPFSDLLLESHGGGSNLFVAHTAMIQMLSVPRLSISLEDRFSRDGSARQEDSVSA